MRPFILSLIVVVLTGWSPHAIAAVEALSLGPDTLSRTQVVVLGSGTPVPNPNRWGPSLAVVVDGTAYIVDAGIGVVRQFVASWERLGRRVSWNGVAFITHLHSDHTLGYPDLILTPWMLGWIDGPTRAVGPPGLEAMTHHLLAAWAEDIEARTGSGGANRSGSDPPQVAVTEIQEGIVYHDELVEVTAFRVNHAPWADAFGYKFRTPDRTIVISGDAGPPSTVVEQCDRCDLLFHEGGRPGADMGEYYHTSHTTAEGLAEIAAQTQPRLLVLYHQSRGNEAGLALVRSLYNGPVAMAQDLDVFQ